MKEAKTLLGVYFSLPVIHFYFLVLYVSPLRVSFYASSLCKRHGKARAETQAEMRVEAQGTSRGTSRGISRATGRTTSRATSRGKSKERSKGRTKGGSLDRKVGRWEVGLDEQCSASLQGN